MVSEIFFQVWESTEGGFEARAVGHSIFTEADSLEALREMIRDAIMCHFEAETRPIFVHLQKSGIGNLSHLELWK